MIALPGVVPPVKIAAAPATAPPPVQSPPEPFRTGAVSTLSALVPIVASVRESLGEIGEIFSPSIPVGFENAKVPTLTERLTSAITPALAFFASTKSAIRTPHSAIAGPPPTGTVLFDFDGDGKADIGRWQGSNTEFKVRNSGNGSYSTHTIGSGSAVPAPGDFDGDGITDAAVFNAGSWTIKLSSNGSTQNVSYGTTGDKPVAADYDGDGLTDIAVFRPSTNVWWIRKSSDLSTVSTSYGSAGDIPVTGNWDGDVYADIAVYRPSTGYWHVQRSTAGSMSLAWGTSSDIPVPADFDGDGKTDLAVYRPSTGAWWIMKSSTGFDGSHISHNWGNYGDQPVPADYDGDGEADLAVWRPKTGVWYISKSSADNEQYEYHSLGVAGNTAVPSAYLAQVGVSVPGLPMAEARLSPKNATGGTDLYSQNFGWGTQLVGLPGRSGLNAGFGISYNSLVWTKLGSEMHFDVDQGNVSPGFRLGFPTIEAPYYNETTEKFSFVMLSPSGSRIEFRQTAVSNLYETADSTYTQLKLKGAISVNTPVEDIEIEIRTTDGRTTTYEWLGGAYRCSQIKDRNGNYITIVHDEDGSLRTVTDTLGRVITVNYDSQLYPTSITQTWKTNNGEGSNTTHTWATFTYTTKTVATNFGSLAVVGPPNDTVIKVLEKVVYSDGSYTKFTHNGYIQVERLENFAADNHVLNRTTTNLDSLSVSQSDCPRFTQTRSYVENFNGGQNVVVNNEPPVSDGYSLPGGLTGDAAKVVVHMDDHPHELYSQVYFGGSGWKEGLTLATEDCTGDPENDCSTRKRWSWTDWTQDNTGVSYILNPRVIETRVGDGTNTRKTTVSYYEPSTGSFPYGLPEYVKVYDTDLSTVLRQSYTEYDLDSAYTSRRIIGLPSKVEISGRETSGLNLMSKVTYEFDEGNFSDSGLQQNISPTQHDGTNYGSSFITGRGNLTSMTRWNVEYPTSSGYAIESSTLYNTAGSPVAQITPWYGTNTRTTRIGYTDNFNSTVGVSTYAYPTVITDPAGSSLGDTDHSSTVKYRYDIGANVEASSPAPAGNTYGKKSKRIYDSIGRLGRDSVYTGTTEHAYTRYEYSSSGIQSKVYSTIIDTDSDGADADDEVLSETFTDGAGRVRLSRTEHPGSTGGWSAMRTEYDILGRVKRQSVPTEVNSSWNPAGDDYRGMDGTDYIWLWTHQKYDWMNRVVRKINTDGDPEATSNDSDILISYEGCGCAGGVITTVESELVPIPGTTNFARRKQKAHTDILGRAFKTETFEWNGTTVYSTIVNTYNGRDQVTLSRQYAGPTSSSTYQDTTATFDGHGRMATSHKPEQRDASNNLKYTSYNYNPDGSVSSLTDGRGVVTSYTYNSRGVVTLMEWDVGSTGVADVTDVEFGYDSAGNRTSMTDGLGTVAYAYNSLSQMTAETRDFYDTLADAPNGVFKLEYTYHIGGQLKSLKDPYGDQINYAYDKTARLDAVTGTSFGGVTTYASNPAYRAWGGLKQLAYGNGIEMSAAFNNRLQAEQFELTKDTTDIIKKNYEYYRDGRLKYTEDELNGIFDRLQTFDHQGRLKDGKSGAEARGGTVTTNQDTELPYRQTYGFNAFSNMTERNNLHWGTDELPYSGSFNLAYTYANNRVTNSNWVHDADGRVTQTSAPDDFSSISYDARGLLKTLQSYHPTNTIRHYDGDGREAKRERSVWVDDPVNYPQSPWGYWDEQDDEYFIRSTVMGGAVISEVGPTGKKRQTFVYGAGTKIATQSVHVFEETSYETVQFHHMDASGMSMRSSYSNGWVYSYGGNYDGAPVEADPMGGNMGIETPYVEEPPEPPPPDEDFPAFEINEADPFRVNGQRATVMMDGIMITQPVAAMLLPNRHGSLGLDLLEFSAVMSQRRIGTRIRGVRWGHAFVAEYGADGSRNIWWGDYDESLHNVSYGIESPIYASNWSAITLVPPSSLTQVSVADCSNDNAVGAFPFVNSAILDAFNAAMRAVNNSIGSIGFTEMFRTPEHQADIIRKRQREIDAWEKSWKPSVFGYNPKPLPVAPVGTSSHEAGYSFDIPFALLYGPRGDQLIRILTENGFIRDVMKGQPLGAIYGDDPPHFTHTSWGEMNDDQRRQAVASAQAAFTKLGFPRRPGRSVSRPRETRPECN